MVNHDRTNRKKNIIVGAYCILRFNPFMDGKRIASVLNEVGISNRGIASNDVGINLATATKRQINIFEKAEGVNWKIDPEYLDRVKL